MYLLLTLYLAMQKIPPVILFSMDNYMPLSEISSDSISVMLSIVSQINPGLLK